MVAAANTALSATADGNQKKPGFPGFIPPGANPQQVAAALAARPMPDVAQGTGLGMVDPMKSLPTLAPAVGGGLAPAFNSGLVGENARYNALPQDNAKNAGRVGAADVPIQASKMGWNDITPLRAPEGARNIYANMGMDDLKQRANLTGSQAIQQPATAQQPALAGLASMAVNNPAQPATASTPFGLSSAGNLTVDNWQSRSAQFDKAVSSGNYGNAIGIGMRTLAETPGAAIIDVGRGIGKAVSAVPVGGFVSGLAGGESQPSQNVQANTPAPVAKASQSQRGDGSVQGLPAALPASAPATAQPVKLGAGAYAGPGIVRIDGGSSPLFTNMTDAAGMADNQKLMGRGAPTAQNMAAMDAMVGRSEKQIADGVKMLQYQDQVAAATAFREAQARQEQSRSFAERLNNPRSEESIAINNLQRQLKPNLGESQAAFAARTAAVQAQINAITGAESLSSAERQNSIRYGLERDRLAADQGYNNARLGLDGRRLANELATGEQSRDAKGMEIAASKQLQSLRDRFMSATGAEQEALGKQLLTMSGKDPKSSMKENFMVVGGGQEWDAQANSMRNVPQTLIDLRTGKPVGGDVGGAKAPTTAVDFLKKNPSQAQAFKDKYGYLPEGFKQ